MEGTSCPHCGVIEDDDLDENVTIELTAEGRCPVCGRDWNAPSGEDLQEISEPMSALPGEDPRYECIRSLGRIIHAYGTCLQAGSAFTWGLAREVLATAEKLVEAEDARAPREAVVEKAPVAE